MTVSKDAVLQPARDIPHKVIDKNYDMILRLYKASKTESFRSDDGVLERRGLPMASFAIRRDSLANHSSFFQAHLALAWFPASQIAFDLCEENTTAMEIWLRACHDNFNGESYSAPIEDVWNTIALGRKYSFQAAHMKGWFENWLDVVGGNSQTLPKFDVLALRSMIFPCHFFEHKQGLATVTRRLAYEAVSHITEINLSRDPNLRVRNVMIQGLNNARFSLRGKLEETSKIEVFTQSTCECRKDGLWEYVIALLDTDVWPFHKALKYDGGRSIEDVIKALDTFRYISPNQACRSCSRDFTSQLRTDVHKIRHDFHGICYDCLNEDGKRNWVSDYKAHNRRRGIEWDKHREINHGQPSSYFSWVSRKQMENAVDREREKLKLKQLQAENKLNGRF